MQTSLMVCDICRKEERDPMGWFRVATGNLYGAERLQISRLVAPYLNTSTKLAQTHVCGLACLTECVSQFAGEEVGPKKRKVVAVK